MLLAPRLRTPARLPAAMTPQIIAVGRLSKVHGTHDAEFAIVISDAFQRQGLGAEIARRLVRIARNEKIGRVLAYYLPENHAMRSICSKLGMRTISGVCDSPVIAALDLP